MKTRIDLVTLWTKDVPRMRAFYQDVLGFAVKLDMGGYVEFENEGVRFSVVDPAVMVDTFGVEAYKQKGSGQVVELAFPCESPEDVDRQYEAIVAKGATPIHPPRDLPWNQRAALFADPDGNIHELFADLPGSE